MLSRGKSAKIRREISSTVLETGFILCCNIIEWRKIHTAENRVRQNSLDCTKIPSHIYFFSKDTCIFPAFSIILRYIFDIGGSFRVRNLLPRTEKVSFCRQYSRIELVYCMQQCVVLPAERACERACCPDYIVELVLPTCLVNREQIPVYSVLYIEWDVVILRFLNTRVHTVR